MSSTFMIKEDQTEPLEQHGQSLYNTIEYTHHFMRHVDEISGFL